MQKRKKTPLIIELIGPAGVGKTTILKSLCDKDRQITTGIHVGKIMFVIFLIINSILLMPAYIFQLKRNRWFGWKEIRAMVYLKAWYFIIHHQIGKNKVVIMDHGPIFRLAFLDEFGPDFDHNSYYMKWWNNVLDAWNSTLDVIIWLDAPNDILLKRIQSRNRWHEIKEESTDTVYEYLNRYRKSCKKIISKLNDDLKVPEFNTQKESPDQISDTVLNLLDKIDKGRL